MSFTPGQKLVCKSTGVTGHFEKQFRATGIGEIVIVRVPDGRLYRAPLSDWEPVIDELRYQKQLDEERIAYLEETRGDYFDREVDGR